MFPPSMSQRRCSKQEQFMAFVRELCQDACMHHFKVAILLTKESGGTTIVVLELIFPNYTQLFQFICLNWEVWVVIHGLEAAIQTTLPFQTTHQPCAAPITHPSTENCMGHPGEYLTEILTDQ